MKIEFSMVTDHMFEVNHWWAKSPDFVVSTLRAQLEAAQAIWPELKQFHIAGRSSKKYAGEAGGHARAAALTPEQRTETARKAANARWKEKREPSMTAQPENTNSNPS